jgi:RNase H-like domain found in reverse transcriptase
MRFAETLLLGSGPKLATRLGRRSNDFSAPAVALPREDLPYTLYLDASFDGLGGSLCQTHDGQEVAICCISRQHRPSEQKYSSIQLECFALVWALTKMHYVLDGAQFTVIPDCIAVKSLINIKTPNRHMLRWQLAIQEFRGQMTIVHREGKQNLVADALSRAPLPNDANNPAADLDDNLPPQVLALDIANFAVSSLTDNIFEPSLSALSMISLNDELVETINKGCSHDPSLFREVEALHAPSNSPTEVAASLPKPLSSDFANGRFL